MSAKSMATNNTRSSIWLSKDVLNDFRDECDLGRLFEKQTILMHDRVMFDSWSSSGKRRTVIPQNHFLSMQQKDNRASRVSSIGDIDAIYRIRQEYLEEENKLNDIITEQTDESSSEEMSESSSYISNK